MSNMNESKFLKNHGDTMLTMKSFYKGEFIYENSDLGITVRGYANSSSEMGKEMSVDDLHSELETFSFIVEKGSLYRAIFRVLDQYEITKGDYGFLLADLYKAVQEVPRDTIKVLINGGGS